MAQSINYVNINQDKTISAFNSFYDFQDIINGEEWDVVYSYMKTKTTSDASAQNLSLAIFKISADNNFQPLDVLNQIKGLGSLELTASLSYFLNSVRNETTYLAVGQSVVPVLAAARNVHT